MDKKKIGQFIARKREEKQLSKSELAEKLGVSEKTVEKWESGKAMPSIELAQVLCAVLDVSISSLVAGEENKSEELVLHLLKIINKLNELRYAIIGLVICNLPYPIESLSFISSLPEGTFWRGFADGCFCGCKNNRCCNFCFCSCKIC